MFRKSRYIICTKYLWRVFVEFKKVFMPKNIKINHLTLKTKIFKVF